MSKILNSMNDELASCLIGGGIAVVRTDTIYGILAKAIDPIAVQKVYDIKSRDFDKSPIVLISQYDDLFDVPSGSDINFLKNVWPGAVSVILPSVNAPSWIVRDNKSVAYRMPDNDELQKLIAKTGPLIAPSANPQGLPPADSIEKASDYFGDSVDIYVDGGIVVDASPSKLLRLKDDGAFEQLR